MTDDMTLSVQQSDEEPLCAVEDAPCPKEEVPCPEEEVPCPEEEVSCPMEKSPCPTEEVLPMVTVEENALKPEITHRLAADFIILCGEFPEIHDPDDLPDEVLDTAAEEGISLLDAYLRFRWQEEKRVRREEERSRRAAARAVGSLVQTGPQAKPEQEAFMRGFRRALK